MNSNMAATFFCAIYQNFTELRRLIEKKRKKKKNQKPRSERAMSLGDSFSAMGDLFADTPERIEIGEAFATCSSAAEAASSSSSSSSSLSSSSSEQSGFVGLRNQGATCYLNSLIQALHMTPEFRAGLFSLSPKVLRFDPAQHLDELRARVEKEELDEQKRVEQEKSRRDAFAESEVNAAIRRQEDEERAEQARQELAKQKELQVQKDENDGDNNDDDDLDDAALLQSATGAALMGMGFKAKKILRVMKANPTASLSGLMPLFLDDDDNDDDDADKEEQEKEKEENKKEKKDDDEKSDDDDDSETMNVDDDFDALFGFGDDDDDDNQISVPANAANDDDDDVELPPPLPLAYKSLEDAFGASSSSLATTSTPSDDDAAESKKVARKKKPVRVIPLALQRLLTRLQSSSERAVSTGDLTASFGWNSNEAFQQQDVHELNRVLFDAIERSLKKTPVESLIESLYRGVLINEIICLKCKATSEREEHFMDLPLPVQDASSVIDSLSRLVSYEKLCGANQYHCDRCDERVDALKGATIRQLPPILMLPLLRFTYAFVGDRFERHKDCKHFPFPLRIDFSSYTEQAKAQYVVEQQQDKKDDEEKQERKNDEEKQESNDDEKQKEKYEVDQFGLFASSVPVDEEAARMYDLFAVVIHKGQSAGFGHYTAYIRDVLGNKKDGCAQEAEPSVGDLWYNFDDGSVTRIATSQLFDQYDGGDCAYMLIYRDASLADKVSEPALPAHMIETVRLEQQVARQHQERADREFYGAQIEVLREADLLFDVDAGRVSLKSLKSWEQKKARTFDVDRRAPCVDFAQQVGANDDGDAPLTLSRIIVRAGTVYLAEPLEPSRSLMQCHFEKSDRALLWNGATLHSAEWRGDGPDICIELVHYLSWGPPGQAPSRRHRISIKENASVGQLRASIEELIKDDLAAAAAAAAASEHDDDDDDAKTKATDDGAEKYFLSFLDSRNVVPIRNELRRALFDYGIVDGSQMMIEAYAPRLDMSIAFAENEHAKMCTKVTVLNRVQLDDDKERVELVTVVLPETQTVFDLKKMALKELGLDACNANALHLFATALDGETASDAYDSELSSLRVAGIHSGARLALQRGDATPRAGFANIDLIVRTANVDGADAKDDGEDPVRLPMTANTSWSVNRLKTEIVELVGLADDSGPFRLRELDAITLEPGKFFSSSHAVLSKEGIGEGALLCLERGRPPPPGELALTFALYTNVEAEMRGVAASTDDNAETKRALAAVAAAEAVDAALVASDNPFDSAANPFAAGDAIEVAKPEARLYSPVLHLHVARNKMIADPPRLVEPIGGGEQRVLNSVPVEELKERVVSLLANRYEDLTGSRLRLWASNNLLKKDNMSLKHQRVVKDQRICVEVLPEARVATLPRATLLFVHKRDSATRGYGPCVEVHFEQGKQDLRAAIARAFNVNVADIAVVAKLLAFNLSWRALAAHPSLLSAKPADVKSDDAVKDDQVDDASKADKVESAAPPASLREFIDARRAGNDVSPSTSNESSMFSLDFPATPAPPAAAAVQKWTCSVCTLENEPTDALCDACQSPAPFSPLPSSSSSSSSSAKRSMPVASADTLAKRRIVTTRDPRRRRVVVRPRSAALAKDRLRAKAKNFKGTSTSADVGSSSLRRKRAAATEASGQRKRVTKSGRRSGDPNRVAGRAAMFVNDGDVLAFKLLSGDPDNTKDPFVFIPKNLGSVAAAPRNGNSSHYDSGFGSSSTRTSSRPETGVQIRVDDFDDTDSDSDQDYDVDDDDDDEEEEEEEEEEEQD
jgi:ubiquitin C-terminal hydrolase